MYEYVTTKNKRKKYVSTNVRYSLTSKTSVHTHNVKFTEKLMKKCFYRIGGSMRGKDEVTSYFVFQSG